MNNEALVRSLIMKRANSVPEKKEIIITLKVHEHKKT